MICKNCGKVLDDGSNFCGFCGTVLYAAQGAYGLNEQRFVPEVQNNSRRTRGKKKAVVLKKIVALLLVVSLLSGVLYCGISYGSADAVVKKIIEASLNGKGDELGAYSVSAMMFETFGFSSAVKEEIGETLSISIVEDIIYGSFNYRFSDDDYDIDWEIISKKKISSDDEGYEYLENYETFMSSMIEKGFISVVFHPQIFIDAVEYEVKFTAQELEQKETVTVKLLLINYNFKWYLFQAYRTH